MRILLALLIFQTPVTHASQVKAPLVCIVYIKFHLKTGAVKNVEYELDAKSKTECDKAAQPFFTNYTPGSVDRVEVKVQWDQR